MNAGLLVICDGVMTAILRREIKGCTGPFVATLSEEDVEGLLSADGAEKVLKRILTPVRAK